MEVTAAARTITGAQSLAEKLHQLVKVEEKVKIAAIAEAVAYSRTTVSRYIAGQYKGEELEEKLSAWYAEYTGEPAVSQAPAETAPARTAGQTPGFFAGRDAKAILGVCQAAQEYREMGIIIGRSGYGKTYALKEYAKLPKVAYIECDTAMGARDLVRELEKSLGLRSTPNSTHDYTIHERINKIVEFLTANPGYLLIVDEADKLIRKYTVSKMDILRAIFDRCSGRSDYSTCGLVIAGEPTLEVLIKNQLSQYANRTLLGAELQGLTEAEVEGYLSGYEIAPDALAELKGRALNSRTGCFRLMNRTMRNVNRILDKQKDPTITLKVIRQASSLMMV